MIGSWVTNCGIVDGSSGTWFGDGDPIAEVVCSKAVDWSPQPFVPKASNPTTTDSTAPDAKARTRLPNMAIPPDASTRGAARIQQARDHARPAPNAALTEAARHAGYAIRILRDTRRTSRIRAGVRARARRETPADRRRSSAATARPASAAAR